MMLWMKISSVRRKSKKASCSSFCKMYFLLWLNQLYLREYKTIKRILNHRRYGLQGEEFVKFIDNTYNEIITWRKNLSKLPSGKAPNINIDSQAIVLKLFIVLPSLVYKTCSKITKLKIIAIKWRNEWNYYCNTAFYNISHKLLKSSQFPEKNSGDSGITHFVEITQAPIPYSMLQNIGR